MRQIRRLVVVSLLLGALVPTTSAAQTRCTASACTAPVTLPWSLSFSGHQGGLAGTGFTLVDPPTAGAGLLSDRLSVAAGMLRITTTAGISIRQVNSQDNTLGVALLADDRAVVLETSLVQPPAGIGRFEQAGLWYGTSEDDYVKLVAISRRGTRVHMLREIGGATTTSVYTPPLPAEPAEVTLRLRIDRAAGTITGAYAVEGGPALAAARWPLPSGLDEPGPGGGAISRGGIFATHRQGLGPLVYAFDHFSVLCAADGCPAGPAPRDPDQGDDEPPIGEPGEPGEEEPGEPGEEEPPPPPGDDERPVPTAPAEVPPAAHPPVRGGASTPTGAPAGGARDRTAWLSVRAHVRRRALLRRGLRARVGCSDACRAKLALRARGKVVARGAGAAPGRIAILPTRRAARRLDGVRRLRVRVRVAFADGSAVTVSRRVRLKR